MTAPAFTTLRNAAAALLSITWLASPVFAQVPKLIASADFENGKAPTGRWTWGTSDSAVIEVSKDPSQNHAHSKGSVRAVLPPTLGGGIYASVQVSLADLNLREVYVDFWAKMPKAHHGLKFMKIFGGRDKNGYANSTLQVDYTGTDNGGLAAFGFGDGSTSDNDFGCLINYNGDAPFLIGRAYGLPTTDVKTPQRSGWLSSNWGTDWHHFRVKVKFNSGTTRLNEINDGEIYVEIDGKVYLDATGLYNRHPLNKPIERISFLDWAQGSQFPFEVWIDDIRISTGGFLPSDD